MQNTSSGLPSFFKVDQLEAEGSPMPRKLCIFGTLPKLRMSPLLRTLWHFLAHIFLPKTEEKIENSTFDFGNEYFDNDCGQT